MSRFDMFAIEKNSGDVYGVYSDNDITVHVVNKNKWNSSLGYYDAEYVISIERNKDEFIFISLNDYLKNMKNSLENASSQAYDDVLDGINPRFPRDSVYMYFYHSYLQISTNISLEI